MRNNKRRNVAHFALKNSHIARFTQKYIRNYADLQYNDECL